LNRRPDDAMDQLLARSAQFHERLPSVREAFAARWPCFAVDASRSPDDVHASIRARLRFALDFVGDR
jgi:thymidylate kinase